MHFIEINLDENEHKRQARLYYEDNYLTHIVEMHYDPKLGDYCGGLVPLSYDLQGKSAYDGENWVIINDTPEGLTISPSIKCNECKSHGWIVDGKWSLVGPPKRKIHQTNSQTTLNKVINNVKTIFRLNWFNQK